MGAPRTTITEARKRNPPSDPATALPNVCTSANDFFERYSESTGTNAWLKAPSANKRRMKLGILLARKKASAASVVPKTRAITMSRVSPRTLDTIVMEPVIPLAFNRPSPSLVP